MQKKRFGQQQTKKQSRNNYAQDLNTHAEDQLEENQEQMEIENQNIRVRREEQSLQNQVNNMEDGDEDEVQNYDIQEISNKQNQTLNQDRVNEVIHSLLLKNKINQKNAFDVPFPDPTKMSVYRDTNEGDTAWKKLSTSLESGSKIYGYRVDSVHQEAYKMLGGLHRIDPNEQKQDEEKQNKNQVNNIDQNDDERYEEIMKNKNNRQQKKDYSGESTLEKNINNIDTNKYDLEFDIDPLFQKTTAKFDESGAKGLLLNNLQINSNMEMLFDSGNILHDQTRQQLVNENNTVLKKSIPKTKSKQFNILEQLGGQSKFIALFNTNLIPELVKFKEQIYSEALEIFENTRLDERLNLTAISENINMPTVNDTINYDREEQDLMEELGRLVAENSDQNMNSDWQEPQADDDYNINLQVHGFQENDDDNISQQNNQEEFETIDIVPEKFNPYSCEDKLKQVGMGQSLQLIPSNDILAPEQWKMDVPKNNKKFGKKSIEKKSDQEQEKKDKKKIEYEFEFNMDEIEEMEDVFGKVPSKTKQNNQKNQQDFNSLRQLHIIPRDFHIDAQRLVSFFMRPADIRGLLQKGVNSKNDAEMIRDGLNNMQIQDQFDNIGGQNDDIDIGEYDANYIQSQVQNLNIENQPNKLENKTGQIPIRELKNTIWTKFSDQIQLDKNSRIEEENNYQQEQDIDDGYYRNNNQQNQNNNENLESLKFSQIIQKLPEILGQNKTNRVSVQTCFVTLLHLANEQTLKFKYDQQNVGADFIICKEQKAQ